MGKVINFPAKILILFDKDSAGNVSIERFVLKASTSIEEYPNFPAATIVHDIELTPAQEAQIKTFCKDVVLPQV